MAGYKVYDSSELVDANEIRKLLETDGAVVVRGVLSAQEVEQARKAVTGHFASKGTRLMLGKTQPNAAIEVDGLDFVLTHPKIIEIYKKIYGDDNVVFTGHCDIHMNMISGWHKDSGEGVGGYFRGDYFGADECRVYKAATYLQDSDGGDGLTVRTASHRTASLQAGNEIKLDTKAGDVVIFDVRLNHIGRSPNLIEKSLKNFSRVLNGGNRNKPDLAIITSIAQAYGRISGRKDRLSIFFTYGPPNTFTYDFAHFNMVRQQRQVPETETALPARLKSRLTEHGVIPFDFDAYIPE